MIWRRICYLLLLTAGGYFMLLYNFEGLRFLLCCMMVIPLLSAFLLLPEKLLCRAEVETEQSFVTRGENVRFTVKIKHRGPFPVSRLLVELSWKAPGNPPVKERRCFHGLGMNAEERFTVELRAGHCGMASLEVRRALAYDLLGLWRMSAGRGKQAEVCVTPVLESVSSRLREMYNLMAGGMGTEREGDLLLRDFQPGDSLHRVYWKLAARSGQLVVRDFERSGMVTVFLDFSEAFAEQAEDWDRYLDKACSLLYFFSEEGRQTLQIPTEVVWRQEGRYLKDRLIGGEAVQSWFCVFLSGRIKDMIFEEEERLPEFCWRLEEDCRLYFGEQCIYEE